MVRSRLDDIYMLQSSGSLSEVRPAFVKDVKARHRFHYYCTFEEM